MTALPSLLELQRGVADALFERKDDVEQWIDGAGLPPAARLQIYRNIGAFTHIEALRSAYPTVLSLVGDDFFEGTAARYRWAHPSTNGNLQEFGDGFADFLEGMREANSLAYLPDVARLDWLRQEAALAADTGPLMTSALMAALAGSPDRLWLRPHPSVRLLASNYPVQTIWRYCQAPLTERLDLIPTGENIVVWRVGQEVAVATLHDASFALLSALAEGHDLDRAHAEALGMDAHFDLVACLGSLIEQELFCEFHTSETPK